MDAMAATFPGNTAEIVRLEIVGPKVGADLTNKALSALYYAILLIAVYISGRFEQRWMAAVSYTHLDVYKRQRGNNVHMAEKPQGTFFSAGDAGHKIGAQARRHAGIRGVDT